MMARTGFPRLVTATAPVSGSPSSCSGSRVSLLRASMIGIVRVMRPPGRLRAAKRTINGTICQRALASKCQYLVGTCSSCRFGVHDVGVEQHTAGWAIELLDDEVPDQGGHQRTGP